MIYDKLTIELTPNQVRHLESIRWLLDEETRAEGKTWLLCVGFIEKATFTNPKTFETDPKQQKNTIPIEVDSDDN